MKYIFGPVPSRRFGLSLGIDIIPRKVCTLDCVYCQIGNTTKLTLQRKPYVAIKPILNELIQVLKSNIKIDYLTFSGSGEPTLNSNIGRLISEIKKITNIPIVVLTNGTLFYRETLRKDLLHADIVAPSLDAIFSFNKINRPHKKLKINKIINGLAEFRKIFKGKIWLEILLVKNINDSPAELKSLRKAILKINPDEIHLNTVVRPPTKISAKPLRWKELTKIKKFFGNKCKIISYNDKKKSENTGRNVSKYILEVLKRRPMQLKDVQNVIGIDKRTILKEMWLLERNKIIVNNDNWWTLKTSADGE